MEQVLRTGDLIEFDVPPEIEEDGDYRIRGIVLDIVLLEDEEWDGRKAGIDLLVGRKKLKDLAEDRDRERKSCRALDFVSDGPQIDRQGFDTNLKELEELGWELIRQGNAPQRGSFRLDID